MDLPQVRWIDIIGLDSWPDAGSTGPELLAVVTIATWLAEYFRDKSIVFHCDNKGVIPMITKEKCSLRNETHLRLIRYFVVKAFEYRFKYWAVHIPGIDNVEADKLSRFYDAPFERLYRLAPPFNTHIAPFFKLNPKFGINSSFTYIELKHHAKFLFDISRT